MRRLTKRLVILLTMSFLAAAIVAGSFIIPYILMRRNTGAASTPRADAGRDWVILLHGIMRSPRSMFRIKKELEDNGFHVINFGYRSTSKTIEESAAELREVVDGIPDEGRTVNFVTHSLGAIVLRYYLAQNRPKGLGRIVMIAPPNKGSALARILKNWFLYKWLFGAAGQQVARSPKSLPVLLPPPRCEFGIIAGGMGDDEGVNPLIPGDDDMTVGVDETRLEGMSDFIIIKGQHSSLLLQRQVIDNTLSFLKTGKFIYGEKRPVSP